MIQFQRNCLRLAGLKKYFLETLQFSDWPADGRILLANVQLGNFCAGAFPGICNVKSHSNLAGTVPGGWLDLQIGEREIRIR